MVERDDRGVEPANAGEMSMLVQIILGLFLISGFIALVWLAFGGS